MSELAAKLNKRRTIVEEDGLHFENSPADAALMHEGEPKAQRSSQARPWRCSSCDQAFAGQARLGGSAGGADLQAALSRRRATVDGDGETFESKPAAKVADCVHEAAASGSGRATAGSPTPGASRLGTNFRTVINSFESKPQGWTADRAAAQSPQRAAEERASAAEQLLEEAPAAASVPTPSRACGSAPAHEEEQAAAPAAAEEARAAASELRPGEEEEEEEEEAGEEALEHIGAHGTITLRRNRITWLVGLRVNPAPDVFESLPFEIGTYGPVTLRLRPDKAGGCALSLHGAEPRPADLRVGLFAGKGWAKRSLVSWSDGTDLEQRFDVNIAGRSSILCGLVYHVGSVR